MSNLETLKAHPRFLQRYSVEGTTDGPRHIADPTGDWVEYEDAADLLALVQQHEATISDLKADLEREQSALHLKEVYRKGLEAGLAKAQETIQQQARELGEAKKLVEAANSNGTDCPIHGPVTTNPCIWCRFDDGEAMDQLVHRMAERFCGWRLPEDFAPDAGITFKPDFNEHTPWPMKHEPTGTNLFTAIQAEAMIRFLLGPESARAQQGEAKKEE